MLIQLYRLPENTHKLALDGANRHGLEIIYHMDKTRNQTCWLVIIIFHIYKINIIM